MRRSLYPVIMLLWIFAGGAALAAPPDELRALALDLVNRDRAEHGLEPLEPDEQLDEAAQRHAEDMLQRDYFAHESPEGRSVLDRFIAAGGSQWLEVAENIAQCQGCSPELSADDLRRNQQGWMESPGHRENILHPHMERFGYGIVAGPGGDQFAVQTFAGPGGARGGDARDTTELSPDQIHRQAVDRLSEARQARGLPALDGAPDLADAARDLAEQLLRQPDGGNLDGGALMDAVAPGRWREIAMAAGSCGGCGTVPSAGDIEFFSEQWIEGEAGGGLSDPRFSHAGVAIVADGQGRKVAVAVFGNRSA